MKESILKRFPELTVEDVMLRDDGDGVYIAVWNSDKPEPTMGEVMSWVEEDTNAPQPLNDTDILGERLVDLELENLDLRSQNDLLGQQVVDLELRLLAIGG